MAGEKEIWKYQGEDDGFKVRISEKENGVVVFKFDGFASGRGAKELFEYVDGHSKKVGRKFRVIADNTELTKLGHDARKVAANFLEADSPIEKLATFGNNFAMRAFMNLYATMSKIPVRFCSSESEAEAWLLGDEGDHEK